MAESKIDITGPGIVVNHVVIAVVKALREAGFTVNVNNDYPPDWPPEFIERCTAERLAGEFKIGEEVVMKTTSSVEINVEHQPWGG